MENSVCDTNRTTKTFLMNFISVSCVVKRITLLRFEGQDVGLLSSGNFRNQEDAGCFFFDMV